MCNQHGLYAFVHAGVAHTGYGVRSAVGSKVVLEGDLGVVLSAINVLGPWGHCTRVGLPIFGRLIVREVGIFLWLGLRCVLTADILLRTGWEVVAGLEVGVVAITGGDLAVVACQEREKEERGTEKRRGR